MEDKSKLTNEQKQKIVEWLTRRPGTLGCPWCHQKNLSIADQLAAAPIATISEGMLLGPHYPLVVLICTNCSHIVFFAARAIEGLVPPIKEEEAKVSGG